MNAKHKCVGRAWSSGSYSSHSCGRTAAYEFEGMHFCKTHHPPTVLAKSAAKTAEWNAAFKRKEEIRKAATEAANEQKRRAELFPEMLDALRRAVLALAFASETSAAMHDDYEAVSAAIAKATGSAA
jgi:hypothetical protein